MVFLRILVVLELSEHITIRIFFSRKFVIKTLTVSSELERKELIVNKSRRWLEIQLLERT